jgi:hypothetical protein
MEEFKDDDAKRPKVSLFPIYILEDAFGRHVGRRADVQILVAFSEWYLAYL